MKENQYIILPSNVISNDIHNDNTTSHFITQLPKAMELDSDYEVALIEINYPHSFLDIIPAEKCSYSISVVDIHEPGARPLEFDACDSSNTKNIFSDQKQIISHLNSIRPPAFKGFFRLIKDMETQKVIIDLTEGDAIILTKFLADILGFDKQKHFFAQGKPTKHKEKAFFRIFADRSPDLHIANYNMFIYSNLVTETLVGDSMLPILRSVPIDPEQRGKYITKSFEKPRYIPLSSNFFQNIEILICDDLGNPIKFQWGKTVIHLHLRKSKPYF